MSNDKIKLPVRVSELYDLGIVDADGTLITKVIYVKFDNPEKTKTIARRDEIIHKHNGYGVAVDALRTIRQCYLMTTIPTEAMETEGLSPRDNLARVVSMYDNVAKLTIRILKDLGELDAETTPD